MRRHPLAQTVLRLRLCFGVAGHARERRQQRVVVVIIGTENVGAQPHRHIVRHGDSHVHSDRANRSKCRMRFSYEKDHSACVIACDFSGAHFESAVTAARAGAWRAGTSECPPQRGEGSFACS